MLFTELGLSEPILRAVIEEGYTVPTPIQAQAIPAVLGGGDLLAGAQTGTGKTAGFMLPILQRLCDSTPPVRADKRKPVRVLILTPTRELAAQVEESARIYGKYVKFSSAVIFGGVGMQPQINTLRRGVDILVATPGRLLDLHQQRVADLSTIEIFVLDEADRMLDMGFIHDIRKVLAVLPTQVNGKPRQNLLFSATFSDDIKALADRLLNKPALIQATPPNAAAPTVEHKMHPVDRDRKGELLVHLVRKNNWQQALVFTRMKHGANKVAEMLEKNGITAMAIHGNKSQTARTKALADFKAGKLQVLVATDIAARGIDIEQLPQVVNYDLPNVPEDYVHRIGRTGRAGSTGQAVSLVTIDETNFLNDIQRLIKHVIPSEVVAGFELDPNAKPEPIVLGRQVLHGAKGSGAGGRGRSGGGGGGGGRGRSAKPAPQSGYAKPNDPRAPAGRSHAPRPASTSPTKPAQGFSGNRAPAGGGNGGGNGGGAGGNRSAGGQRSAGGGGAGNGQARHSGAPRRSGSGA